MKHFFTFLVVVFGVLLFWTLNRERDKGPGSQPSLRVVAYSSFVNAWGPGPQLKQSFETKCNCTVQLIDGGESNLLVQKVKQMSLSSKVDVAIGLDQFDLQLAEHAIEWKKLPIDSSKWDDHILSIPQNANFIPFDWGVLSVVTNKDHPLAGTVVQMDDPKAWRKIALQDPRTSTPGLQFLLWIVQVEGEDGAMSLIETMQGHIHSYSASWATAYGFFQRKQAQSVFSYITSPIYHSVEENDDSKTFLTFASGHPRQIEFLGVPSSTAQPLLAEDFVSFVMGQEGQKIIMSKNYMFPVLKGVRENTPFAKIEIPKLLPWNSSFDIASRARIIKRWTELRK